MKVRANPRLFWFLKEGSSLDLDEPSTREMYVQQVLSRGSTKEVRDLLKTLDPPRLEETFEKIKLFLPGEVRSFWEDFFGNSFAQDAAFRFKPPQEFPEFPGLKVDSLEDIASNKLLALFGRATLRDFVGKSTRKVLTEKAQEKDPGFDLYWLGVAFERIKTFQKDSPELLSLAVSVDFEELNRFFDGWREEITKSLSL